MKTLKKKFKEYDKLLDIIKSVIGDKSENNNNNDSSLTISKKEIDNMLLDTKNLLDSFEFDNAKKVVEGLLDFNINNEIKNKLNKINNCIDKLEIEESLKLINEIVEGC